VGLLSLDLAAVQCSSCAVNEALAVADPEDRARGAAAKGSEVSLTSVPISGVKMSSNL